MTSRRRQETEVIEWGTDREGVQMLWPDPETGPLVLRAHFAIVQERVALVGLDVRTFTEDSEGRRAPGPGGLGDIDYAALRSLSISEITEKAKVRAAIAAVESARDAAALVPRERLMEAMGARRTTRRRSPEDEELLVRVAQLYDLAIESGGIDARRPAKFVERRLIEGGREVTPEQVRQYIARARKEGLLAPATRKGDKAT